MQFVMMKNLARARCRCFLGLGVTPVIKTIEESKQLLGDLSVSYSAGTTGRWKEFSAATSALTLLEAQAKHPQANEHSCPLTATTTLVAAAAAACCFSHRHSSNLTRFMCSD
uniref:Phenylalanine--tRNA ligase alpha subunit n=1 Tax=Anthurium amnicola TaxID=1678845 RepID=A0A1D1ZFN7_9ARAE